jgi:hypothetical protein
VAFRRYLDYLVRNQGRLKQLSTAASEEFKSVAAKDADVLTRSPLRSAFERLYVTGFLAIAAGALPWKRAPLRRSLLACLKVAHQHAFRDVVSLAKLQ